MKTIWTAPPENERRRTPAPPPPLPPALPAVRTRFTLRGSYFAAFLSNSTASAMLRNAVLADLTRLLAVDANRIEVLSLRLGSLVVDFRVTVGERNVAISTVEAMRDTLAVGLGEENRWWLVNTSALYATVGVDEKVWMVGAQAAAEQPPETAPQESLCGPSVSVAGCHAIIVVPLLGALLVGVTVFAVVRYRRKQALLSCAGGTAAAGSPRTMRREGLILGPALPHRDRTVRASVFHADRLVFDEAQGESQMIFDEVVRAARVEAPTLSVQPRADLSNRSRASFLDPRTALL